jgi:hypothetical protein
MKSTPRGPKSAQTWDSLFYKAADDFTKAGKVKAEIKRRDEDRNQADIAYAKELRADIAKRIKLVTDIDLLSEIQSMLPELPMEESPI